MSIKGTQDDLILGEGSKYKSINESARMIKLKQVNHNYFNL